MIGCFVYFQQSNKSQTGEEFKSVRGPILTKQGGLF